MPQLMDNHAQRRIADMIAEGYPVAGLARRVGEVTRQDIYNFLEPQKYPYRLTEEKLQRIAEFEGRDVADVRAEYESKRAA